VREERLLGGCVAVRAGVRETICREIDPVKSLTRSKVQKLRLATDRQTGLEIMHLFVLDQLGRDTPAARIFEQKSDEDFKRTRVVTHFSNCVVAAALLGLNAFFAYYCVLYGYVHVDYTIRIWDAETGANLRTLQGHCDAVRLSCPPHSLQIE
jgi:WD40 repeat protein